MTGFRFQSPWWFLLLLPWLYLAFQLVRRRGGPAILFSSVELVRGAPRSLASRIKPCLPWVRMLGLLALVVALARPQFGREEVRIDSEGIAIEMCIDRSGSMRARDFQIDGRSVNRLEVVKRVFHDFVLGKGNQKGRAYDQIGLIAFGGYVDSLCPLTFDHRALLEILDTVDLPKPIVDPDGRVVNREMFELEQGTAIGDALAVAVDRLRTCKAKSKIVILLSDGESNLGTVQPLEAAEAAKRLGIKIYTIGIGTVEGVPLPREDAFGRMVMTNQIVRLNEEALKEIAAKTNGQYWNAQDTATLAEVYATIDQLEKTKIEQTQITKYGEMYGVPLWVGLGMILLEVFGTNTRFRTLP